MEELLLRLDKLLAHTGFGTRKEVKELIRKGNVTVDDKIIRSSNATIDPNKQIVTVFGEEIFYQKFVYIMLHKPAGFITATEDVYHDTVLSLIPEAFAHFDLSPVGRLDKDTEGLLILTNDGKANHVLTSPKKNIPKTYFAKINGTPTEEHIDVFKQGVTLDDGYETKEATLEILSADTMSEIKLTITEGKFHQVKRMFRAIGMEVLYLKRLTMGDITLDPDLPIGKTRELTMEELQYIERVKK